MSQAKLTDREVHERLVAAADALGRDEGQTSAGDTALATARKALIGLQFAMVAIMDRETGTTSDSAYEPPRS